MNITIKTEWLEAAKTLQSPFDFIEAIALYIQSGEEPAIASEARGMFIIIKKEIDQRKKATARVQKHRENSVTPPLQSVTGRYSNGYVTGCNVTENSKENPPAPPKENTKKRETKVSPKESEALSFEQLIPPQLKTVEFEIAWQQWCHYRK